MSARLWMLESRSSQSRSPVLYRVAARFARISRCRSRSFSARLSSMRERCRRWLTSSSFSCASIRRLAHGLQLVLQVRHLGARALGLLLQVVERGGGRRRGAPPRRPATSAARRTASSAAPAATRRGAASSCRSLWRGWTCLRRCRCPACSLLRGIGPAGRFLTAGQAGAPRRPVAGTSRRARESLSEGSRRDRPGGHRAGRRSAFPSSRASVRRRRPPAAPPTRPPRARAPWPARRRRRGSSAGP